MRDERWIGDNDTDLETVSVTWLLENCTDVWAQVQKKAKRLLISEHMKKYE